MTHMKNKLCVFQALIWAICFGAITLDSSFVMAEESCESECSNLKDAPEELKAECDSYKLAKQSVISESVLIGLDGATEVACTLACSQIAIPFAGALSATSCDAMGLASGGAEMIAMMVLNKGQVDPTIAMSLVGMGISAHGLYKGHQANRAAAAGAAAAGAK